MIQIKNRLKTILVLTSLVTALSGHAATVQVYTEADAKLALAALNQVSNAELPALYSQLVPKYELLTKALESRLRSVTKNSELSIESQVIIVKDKSINATAYVIGDANGKIVKMVSVLTTGLVSTFIQSNNSEEVLSGILKILGASAHELAHTIDKADPDGIEQNVGYRRGSQAIEFRTDFEAENLLRVAHLPTEMLFHALEDILNSRDRDLKERASLMTSSHPEPQSRLAAARLTTTAQRVRNGANERPQLDPAEAQAIFEEVRGFTRDSAQLVIPKDLDDLTRLSSRPPHPKSRAWVNLAMLWFDQSLANGTLEASDEEIEKARHNLIYSSGWGQLCKTRRCLEELFKNKSIPGLSELKLIPHIEYLNTLPFYNRRELIDLKDFRLMPLGSSEGALEAIHLSFVQYEEALGISRELIFTDLDRQTIATAEADLRMLLEVPMFFHWEMTSDEVLKFAHYLHSRVMYRWAAEVGPLKLTKSLQGMDMTVFSGLAYQVSVPTKKSRQLWSRLFDRTNSAADRAEARETLELIWQNRGLWTYLEFVSKVGFCIDWDFIAKQLEVPRDQVNQELRNSFTGFLRSLSSQNLSVPAGFLENRSAPVFNPRNRPTWMRSKFEQLLKSVYASSPDPALQRAFKKEWMSPYYRFYSGDLNPAFKRALRAQLSRGVATSPADIWNAILEAEDQVTGYKYWSLEFFPNLIVSTLEELKSLGLNPTVLKEFSDSVIFKNANTIAPDADGFDKETWRQLYRAQASDFLDSGVSGFLAHIQRSLQNPEYQGFGGIIMQSAIRNLTEDLSSEIAKMDFAQIQQSLVLLIKEFKPGEFELSDVVTTAISHRLQQLKLSDAQKLRSFWQLTKFSRDESTDALFKVMIAPIVKVNKKNLDPALILRSRRIHSSQLRMDLAKATLGSQLDTEEIPSLIEKINQLNLGESNARDEFLEEIAWRRGISDDDLETYIEREKMTSWRKFDPKLVSYGGYFSEVVNKLSSEAKLGIVHFLISGGTDVASLDLAMKSMLAIAEKGLDYVPKNYGGLAQLRVETYRKVYDVKNRLIFLAKESTPVQRLPAVEFVLSSGHPNLLSQSSVISDLIRKTMNIQPGSLEAGILKAYLEVLPPRERAAHISYMLLTSSTSTGARNIRSIFEAFGAIGIKFGQMAAVWDIFGPEYREQLENLFDQASRMTKFEIETILKDKLGETVPGQTIKRLVKVLGSASIKTVVLAELQNGQTVALMVKRQYSKEQTMTNIKLAKAFLNELKSQSLESTNPLFMPLVEAIEAQMSDELDFTNEVTNYKAVTQMMVGINSQLKGESENWSIVVPEISSAVPANSDVFATAAASGVTAKEYFSDKSVADSEKQLVGRLLTKVSLRMLFQYGQFDPDRHPGNWLIDRNSKTISFIDPGQLVRFPNSKSMIRYDGRLTIAQFLQAFRDRDAKTLVSAALKMRKVGDQSQVNTDRIVENVQKLFTAKGSEEDLLKQAIAELYQNNLSLDAIYTFGALKGFLVLAGSHYVSWEDFSQILSSEVTSLYVKKAPALAVQGLTDMVNSLGSRFLKATRWAKTPSCEDLLTR